MRGEASNEIKHQYLSAAKARRMLGWNPHYTLDVALQETIAWYRDYFLSLLAEQGRLDAAERRPRAA